MLFMQIALNASQDTDTELKTNEELDNSGSDLVTVTDDAQARANN